MDFKTFWFGMSQDERGAFAEKVERSPGYLQLVAGGFRNASPGLATAIHVATDGKVTREEMRADIYGTPPPTTGTQAAP